MVILTPVTMQVTAYCLFTQLNVWNVNVCLREERLVNISLSLPFASPLHFHGQSKRLFVDSALCYVACHPRRASAHCRGWKRRWGPHDLTGLSPVVSTWCVTASVPGGTGYMSLNCTLERNPGKLWFIFQSIVPSNINILCVGAVSWIRCQRRCSTKKADGGKSEHRLVRYYLIMQS